MSANKDENSDLWWALKGGSNNFGIVTRLDMSTFSLPNGVWGGFVTYEHSHRLQRKTAEAFYKFQIEGIAEDPGVESITGWGKTGSQKFIQHVLSADRPVSGDGHPKAFDDFFALEPASAQVGSCLASELASHDTASTDGPQSFYFSEQTRYVKQRRVGDAS